MSFRQLRNKYTLAVRIAKVTYFKQQLSLSGSSAQKCQKTVKDLENQPSSSELPLAINVDNIKASDKTYMAHLFNTHFIKSGSLFTKPPCSLNTRNSDPPHSYSSLLPLHSYSPQSATEAVVRRGTPLN